MVIHVYFQIFINNLGSIIYKLNFMTLNDHNCNIFSTHSLGFKVISIAK